MAAVIQLKRSVIPIHIGETIDEILQHVLYHRHQVPVLVPALFNDPDSDHGQEFSPDHVRLMNSKKAARFRENFSIVRNGIHGLFRSTAVERAAIIIGSSPSFPTDVYLIEFPKRTLDAEHCELLSKSERRLVTSQLIDQGVCYQRGDHRFKPINAVKTFLLVEAKRAITVAGFNPRPDLDLDRYCEQGETKKSGSANWIRLKIADCAIAGEPLIEIPENVSMDRTCDPDEKAIIWYQFNDSIMGFSQ